MTALNPNRSVIDRLQRHLETAIEQAIDCRGKYSLVDFPNHSNIGDSAIYLGEALLLEKLFGRKPSLVAEALDYALNLLERRPRTETIFLHGGGNFGDLWPKHQLFREAVLRRFPDRRIIQLPQSIHFDHDSNLARAASVINAHPNFTLMVRDEAGVAIAKGAFNCDVRLVPDAAFMIGPVEPSGVPDLKVLCIIRQDQETNLQNMDVLQTLPTPSLIADWPNEHGSHAFGERLRRRLRRLVPTAAHGYRPANPSAYERLARIRVDRGLGLLSRGKVVLTDRLHAHILCVLLGKAHVVLDNRYGKIGNFLQAFTADTAVSRASGLKEAVALASAAVQSQSST